MANIAEMVKELQQERDRMDQAIAALAPLAGMTRSPSARGGAKGPHRIRGCAKESVAGAEGTLGQIALREFRES